MASLGELFVTVGANVAGFKAAMTDVKGVINDVDDRTNKQLLAGFAAIAGASLAAGVAYQDAMAEIRTGTGATGDALKDLGGIFNQVFTAVPQSANEAARAVADLNTRLGLSGDQLRDLSIQMLNLARITKSDVGAVVAETTRVFGDWSVATQDMGKTLDYLFKVSQSTGISLGQLSQQLVFFGAPLRQMGFDLETSAALLGKFEKEGVNAELVMGSLRIGLTRMAKEGINDASLALEQIVERIKSAGSAGEANRISMEMFGAKAGPDMAAAIREGRFEISSLLTDLRASSETVNAAAEDSKRLSDEFSELKNRATSLLAPLGALIIEGLNALLKVIDPVVEAIKSMRETIATLPGPVKVAVGLFGPLGVVMDSVSTESKKVTTESKKLAPALKAVGKEADAAAKSNKAYEKTNTEIADAQKAAKKAADDLRDAYSKLGLRNLGKEAGDLASAMDLLKRTGDWQKLTAEQQAAATAKLNDAMLAAKGYTYNWQQALIGLTTQQDSARRSTQAMFDEMERVGDGIQGVSRDIRDMPMGMINEELLKQAEAAAKTSGEIYALENAYRSADLKNKNAIYEMLRDQIKAAEEAGETVPREQREMLEKMEKDLGRGGKLDNVKGAWGDFSREVSTIITNFSQDIAKSLWEGDMSWGEKGIKLLKDLGAAVTSAFIQPAVAAITGFVKDTLEGLLGGALDGIASKWGKIIGGGASSSLPDSVSILNPGGYSAPSAPSAPSGGGAGSASGVMGTIGAIGSVGSMVSGIIGNFQMMGMNKTLDLIEESTRWTKIDIHNLLPKLTNDFASALPGIHDRLMELREIGIAVWPKDGYEKSFGGGTTVNIEGNVIGNQEFVREMASLVAAELALQGAV